MWHLPRQTTAGTGTDTGADATGGAGGSTAVTTIPPGPTDGVDPPVASGGGAGAGGSGNSSVPPPSGDPSVPPSQPSSQPPSSNPPPPITDPPPSSQSSSIISRPPPSSDISSIPPSSSPSSSSSRPVSAGSSSSSAISGITTPPPTSQATASSDLSIAPSSIDSSLTTSFTTIVTKINGVDTTITSPLPTNLYNPSSSSPSPSKRVATIAGATTGAVVLFLLLLGAVFLYRRQKLQEVFKLKLLGKKEKKGLLDEEFDDEDEVPMRMRAYRDSPPGSLGPAAGQGILGRDRSATTSTSLGHALGVVHPGLNPPPLFRAQASESGSIFREEGIWPPGKRGEFVDPFVGGVLKSSSEVNLGGIVEGVMGPGGGAAGASGSGSDSGVDSGSQAGHDRQPTSATTNTLTTEFGTNAHHHTQSRLAANVTNSSSPLPPIPPPQDSINSMYTDPFRDASRDGHTSATSAYFPDGYVGGSSGLPPGAGSPITPGLGYSPTEGRRRSLISGNANEKDKKEKRTSLLESMGDSLWLGRKPGASVGTSTSGAG